MTAVNLHYTSNVGTTYKRALQRFHLSRDVIVSSGFSALPLIDSLDNWIVLHIQLKDDAMRKPRDYDAELKALDGKAKALKARRLEQLGQLVMATGADTLPIEQLAGALLIATEQKDAAAVEAQRARGAAFFQAAKRAGRDASDRRQGSTSNGGATTSPVASERAP
jgi:hypothetical protein